MKQCEINPFYHPTTVLFVDDRPDFLKNLSLQLDKNLAFRLYTSASAALEELNGQAGSCAVEKFFHLSNEAVGYSISSHVVDLNTDHIHREVHNEERFKRITAVVVDYDMPEMNGLEFCERIRDPLVKKIMLTGKADANIAMEAFNAGLIDRFLMKSDPEIHQKLNAVIAQMQHAYFAEAEKMLSDVLSIGAHEFLRDEKFAGFFSDICKELGIVEHYLCTNPASILMLDYNATPYLLIVQTERELISTWEIAYDNAAPRSLMDALQSGEFLPHFWRTMGGQYEPVYINWRDYLHPAKTFKGKKWYLYALIKNPQSFKSKTVLPYLKFLDELDLKCSSR